MNKIISWIKQSNRYKHLIGGFVIGLLSLCPTSGLYATFLVALALEYKDKLWGGKFDWLDALTTMIGGIAGTFLNILMR